MSDTSAVFVGRLIAKSEGGGLYQLMGLMGEIGAWVDGISLDDAGQPRIELTGEGVMPVQLIEELRPHNDALLFIHGHLDGPRCDWDPKGVYEAWMK